MNPSHPLQARFLVLLPTIETHAKIHFRDIKCPDRKADQIADVVASAWKWFVRLEQRGKDVNQFLSVFATLAARAVRSGRRLAGMERSKDVLSSRAQQRWGFAVQPLPACSTLEGNDLDEALRDNTRTPPPDAAAFRIDFPRWLATLNKRNRRLARDLMIGEQTFAAARKFGVSSARVSQIRQELHSDWQRFHGEPVGDNE